MLIMEESFPPAILFHNPSFQELSDNMWSEQFFGCTKRQCPLVQLQQSIVDF